MSQRFGNWFSVELEAQKYIEGDPDRAARIYEEGISELPSAAPLLGNYALYLKNVRHDYDRAQELSERAVTADPNHANNLGAYALFLTDVRHDHDRGPGALRTSRHSRPQPRHQPRQLCRGALRPR